MTIHIRIQLLTSNDAAGEAFFFLCAPYSTWITGLKWRSWYLVVYSREAGSVNGTAKFLERHWSWLLEVKSTSSSTAGGHPCSQHANCMFPQTFPHPWLWVVWYNCTLQSGTPVQRSCCLITILICHTSGGWIVLAQETCSLTKYFYFHSVYMNDLPVEKVFRCMQTII